MKLIRAIGLLFFVASVHAQDLPLRLKAQWRYDPTLPITLGPLVQENLFTNTPTPEGMVWVEDRDLWFARLQGSCEWCGKPMTFKQAAFDKKALGLWGVAIALDTADAAILATRPCVRQGTCREGNPALRSTSFKAQMSIKMPALVISWMISAYARKGDKSYHVGGMKKWWFLPMLYQGLSTAGIIHNSVR
jgi:hypothetical protein